MAVSEAIPSVERKAQQMKPISQTVKDAWRDFFLLPTMRTKAAPSRPAPKIAEAYEQGNLMTARRRSKMCNVKTQSTGDEANVKREPLKGRRTSKKPARQIV